MSINITETEKYICFDLFLSCYWQNEFIYYGLLNKTPLEKVQNIGPKLTFQMCIWKIPANLLLRSLPTQPLDIYGHYEEVILMGEKNEVK